MKILAQTTGNFMMLDIQPAQEVEPDRPTVIQTSPLVNAWVAKGKLEILATDLPDEFTDLDFLAMWRANSQEALAKVKALVDLNKNKKLQKDAEKKAAEQAKAQAELEAAKKKAAEQSASENKDKK